MGIGSDVLHFLEFLKRENYILANSAVIEIGAQQLSNDFLRAEPQLEAVRRLFNVEKQLVLPEAIPTNIAHGELEALDRSAPASREFWTWLGFEYASIDIDGSPGSIPLDLNHDNSPSEVVSKFGLVTNFGTTEHVVNQLNAFKVIHDLTAVGGIMIHNLPSQGFLNHGLVNYNPKFFWYLARSNGYNILYMDFCTLSTRYAVPDNIVNDMSSYTVIPKSLREFTIGDAAIRVIMQKATQIPFIAPLDVSDGTTTDLTELKERYWTVFDRDAFRRYRDRDKPWWLRLILRSARVGGRFLRSRKRRFGI